jgi:hypothetical protein
MKLALAALALALCASASLAEPRRPAPSRGAPASVTARAAVAMGRDGQDARLRCSTENRNIEYRDCVNASTRDPNAKVRLG